MADKKPEITGTKRSEITVVAEDKNWRSYVANELSCADRWQHDWGFLQGGALEEGKEPAPMTKEERIGNLENKLKNMHAREYVTASQKIGKGETLEMFPMIHLNI